MKRFGYILMLTVILASCNDRGSQASFRMVARGFILKESQDCQESSISYFEHKISGGQVKFIRNQGVFAFNLDKSDMGDYLFQIPEGHYTLEVTCPAASIYGQSYGSYLTDPFQVTVSELTDTLFIDVESNCSLLLVEDEFLQLEEGAHIIERHSYSEGYFTSYPMSYDSLSGFYYAYFTPDPMLSDPSAYLWFYGKNQDVVEGGYSTTDFETGYQYCISVFE